MTRFLSWIRINLSEEKANKDGKLSFLRNGCTFILFWSGADGFVVGEEKNKILIRTNTIRVKEKRESTRFYMDSVNFGGVYLHGERESKKSPVQADSSSCYAGGESGRGRGVTRVLPGYHIATVDFSLSKKETYVVWFLRCFKIIGEKDHKELSG